MVMVETEQGAVGVNSLDVIAMYPVKSGFWNRLDLSARLGFSWDKGSNVGRYNLGIDAVYRDPDFITRAGFSTEVTTQEDREDTQRSSLSANHMAFRQNKRFVDYFGILEKNDQLGLDLRALAGAGYGWIPIRSNSNFFSVAGGAPVLIPISGWNFSLTFSGCWIFMQSTTATRFRPTRHTAITESYPRWLTNSDQVPQAVR
jgi:hypothetical protein